MVILFPTTTPFSYENQNQIKPQELDTFDQIALSLHSVTKLVSEDEYEDYNSQESYEPGKKEALT